jgi:protein-S-isoprenylcysteine O-methyltransferase Ste14
LGAASLSATLEGAMPRSSSRVSVRLRSFSTAASDLRSCGEHSVMARPQFKELWTRIVPKPIERSTYVLFSSAALILLFWQWRPMGGVVWSIENPAISGLLRALFAFGWALVLLSTFLINHFDLFGLRQVWLYLNGRPYTNLKFATPGPYRLVRHPLYAGWLFAFWMTPTMTLAHLVFSVMTTAYILLAIQWEERDLSTVHGKPYEEYRKSVPMILPVGGRRAAPASADAVGLSGLANHSSPGR